MRRSHGRLLQFSFDVAGPSMNIDTTTAASSIHREESAVAALVFIPRLHQLWRAGTSRSTVPAPTFWRAYILERFLREIARGTCSCRVTEESEGAPLLSHTSRNDTLASAQKPLEQTSCLTFATSVFLL